MRTEECMRYTCMLYFSMLYGSTLWALLDNVSGTFKSAHTSTLTCAQVCVRVHGAVVAVSRASQLNCTNKRYDLDGPHDVCDEYAQASNTRNHAKFTFSNDPLAFGGVPVKNTNRLCTLH